MVNGHEVREERNDYRTCMVLAMLANIHRDTKKRKKPYEPQDFMLSKVKPKKVQSEDEMLAVVKILNAAFGGKVVD